MLTVRILCVGKCKEKYWREACAEYGKRLSAFCRFEVLEVDEERLPERPSKAQIESGLEQEGKRLLQKAGSTPIVALCIEGKELSSPQLAQYGASRSKRRQQPGLCHRRLLGTVGGSKAESGAAAFHVSDDLSSSAGQGYALRADLSRLSDCPFGEIP